MPDKNLISLEIPKYILGDVKKICDANNLSVERFTTNLLLKFVKGTGLKTSKEIQEALGFYSQDSNIDILQEAN